MMRLWLCAGAANGFVAVAMGAFAAHGSGAHLSEAALAWIETARDYGMVHALALLAVAALSARAPAGRWLALAGWAFLAGTLLFSGGLYLMALAGLGSLGPVVPAGGIAYLIGWAALLVHGLLGRTASPPA